MEDLGYFGRVGWRLCYPAESITNVSQWGTRPPPIPTATLSLAITGAGWDLQYVCQSMSDAQHIYTYIYIYIHTHFLKGLFLQSNTEGSTTHM